MMGMSHDWVPFSCSTIENNTKVVFVNSFCGKVFVYNVILSPKIRMLLIIQYTFSVKISVRRVSEENMNKHETT